MNPSSSEEQRMLLGTNALKHYAVSPVPGGASYFLDQVISLHVTDGAYVHNDV